MKFKTIFIIFNAVILASFLFLLFLPVFTLGSEFLGQFISSNWYVLILFAGAVAVLNVYFASNWKFFQVLETEDWDKIKAFLKDQVLEKQRYRHAFIQTLINTALITSDLALVEALEKKLREKKPALAARFALYLGLPHLLSTDPIRAELFYRSFVDEKRARDRLWLQWVYAFSLILAQDVGEAKKRLLTLRQSAKEPVLILLTLYLLDSVLQAEEKAATQFDAGCVSFRSSYGKDWEQILDKGKENLLVLILSKVVKEASDWLFRKTDAAVPGKA